jgi:hypothetical protein
MMAHAIVINLGNHLLSHCGVPRLRARATAELVADAGVGRAAADWWQARAATNLVAYTGTGDLVGQQQS